MEAISFSIHSLRPLFPFAARKYSRIPLTLSEKAKRNSANENSGEEPFFFDTERENQSIGQARENMCCSKFTHAIGRSNVDQLEVCGV